MTSQPETGTPARSLPPIPDEARRAAEAAFEEHDHGAIEQGVDNAVAAAYPHIARAVLDRAADLVDRCRPLPGENTPLAGVDHAVDVLRRLAREATTERTQP